MSAYRWQAGESPVSIIRPALRAFRTLPKPIQIAVIAQIGRDREVDIESGIDGTKIDRGVRAHHQPPRSLRRRQLRILELDHAAPLRQRSGIEAEAHVPHEQRRVEMRQRKLGLNPALFPNTERLHQGLKLAARGGQVLFEYAGLGRRWLAAMILAVSRSFSRCERSPGDMRGKARGIRIQELQSSWFFRSTAARATDSMAMDATAAP